VGLECYQAGRHSVFEQASYCCHGISRDFWSESIRFVSRLFLARFKKCVDVDVATSAAGCPETWITQVVFRDKLWAAASAESLRAGVYFLHSVLPTSRVLLDKLTVTFLVRQLCAFCVARSFLLYSRSVSSPLLKTRCIQFTTYLLFPVPPFWYHFHLLLYLPNYIFPTGLPIKSSQFCLSDACYMHGLSQPLWFDHWNVYWGVQNMKRLIVHFSPVTCCPC